MYLYLITNGWDANMRVYNWKKHNKLKENELEIIFKEGMRIVNDSQKPWNEKQYGFLRPSNGTGL